MRYKIFNGDNGEPLGHVDDIFQAVELANMIQRNADFKVAIKDENTGVIL